jgi:predicted ATPase
MSKAWNRKRPSLRSWELSNFKSVVDASIPLAPLTLVVGANSAGKSTLLQSILLMAQAATQVTPGPFPLNGSLVGLGKFSEARSDFEDREGETIGIGGSLALPFPLKASRFLLMRGELDIQDGVDESGDSNIISWNLHLAGDTEMETSDALVEACEVSFAHGNDLLGKLSVEGRPIDEVPPPMLESQQSVFGDKYEMTEYMKERSTSDGPSDYFKYWRMGVGAPINREYGAVSFEAGIPVNGLVQTDEITWLLDVVKYQSNRFRFFFEEDQQEDDEFANLREMSQDEAINHLHSLLEERCKRVIEARRIGTGLGIDLSESESTSAYSVISRDDYSESIYPRLRKLLSDDVGGSRGILASLPPAGPHSDMTDIAADVPQYFRGSVLYLGPLREDPRVTYPHAIAGSTHMPLGRKGESTASFLLQNTSGRRSMPTGPYVPAMPASKVTYPLPSRETTRSLELAVNSWVKEFKLGQSFDVQDQARYGVGFTIDARDLTSVGTGVSQVLPVIVLCLVAQPGQLILLEQPELHLNPGLQQHLADFFLAMVRSGRQLLVETHSEYMVTRLRRRVAEDTEDEVRNLFNFVFAAQDEQRKTRFRVLDVDRNGALDADEWPTGFFDQAGNDVDEMMRIALNRRR